MTVLDVGCGSGYYSLGAAELVGPAGRVIAVDIDTDAIAALRTKAQKAGLPERIEPRVSSEQDLGVLDLSGEVDFALAVYVVHHAKDPSILMSDVHKALRAGGKFLVIEPRHHASTAECESTESAARAAGFVLADHPRLKRDWAATFVKGGARLSGLSPWFLNSV